LQGLRVCVQSRRLLPNARELRGFIEHSKREQIPLAGGVLADQTKPTELLREVGSHWKYGKCESAGPGSGCRR